MSFVLDASVAFTWMMRDEDHPLADLAFARIRLDYAAVPGIWWYEIRNMLVVNERRGRISVADSTLVLKDMARMRIRVHGVQDHANLLSLARQFQLTVYDAAYLDLAVRERLPIASLDKKLRAAAETAGVPLLA
jgi:predicted nucleic acid-binding protein